jgi:hypothetical protein
MRCVAVRMIPTGDVSDSTRSRWPEVGDVLPSRTVPGLSRSNPGNFGLSII